MQGADVPGSPGIVPGESILVCDGAAGTIRASTGGSQAEMPAPPALRGHALLKFETLVHL